jgi:hypothetical protein
MCVTSRPRLVLCFLLLAAGACKCGQDEQAGPAPGERDYASTVGQLPGAALVRVAGLLPADAQLVLLSDRPEKVLGWLAGRPWWQELRASPVWADLVLSGPLYRLSSLRHEVAAASPVRLPSFGPDELLVGPVGLAVTFDGQGSEALLVKSVDLRVQALERLAEAFNQAKPGERIQAVSVEGFELRKVELGPDRAVYYHLFSNLLLVSSSQELLVGALRRASGKPDPDSLAGHPVLGKLLQETGDRELVGLLTPALPASLGGFLLRALPVPALALGLELGESPRLGLRAPLAEDAPGAFPADLAAGLRLAPLESRLVLAHAGLDAGGVWKALAESAPGPEGEGEEAAEAPGFPEAPASLGQAGLLVLGGVEAHAQGPRVHAALLVPARDAAEAEEFARGALLATFEGGLEPVAGGAGGRALLVVKGVPPPWSPACAALPGWLLCGTTVDMVKKVLACAAGQAPSLGDAPGLKARLLGQPPPAVGLGYLDLDGLARDGLVLLRAGAGFGERFDANDVDDTLGPFLQAIGRGGKLAGGLWARPPALEGSVVPL